MGAAGIGKVLWMGIAGSGKSQAGTDCLDLVGRKEPIWECQTANGVKVLQRLLVPVVSARLPAYLYRIEL